MNLSDFGPSSSDSSINKIVVFFDEDERQHARDIAKSRHCSYSSGRTRDESWGGSSDSFDAMLRGVLGELALSALYNEAEFDSTVSDSGDGGVDTVMELGDTRQSVDIKTSTYDGHGASIMVAKHHVDERSVTPDTYVSSHVEEDLSTVSLRGWVESDDLLVKDNLRKSPVGDWMNYELNISELNAMPYPTGDLLNEGDDYQLG